MTTLTSHAPIPLHNGIQAELEPDKEWKDDLRARIEDHLSSMVEGAKKTLEEGLNKGKVSDMQREALNQEYSRTMDSIRTLAQESYVAELQRERQERRWTARAGSDPNKFIQEQKDIMNSIHTSPNDTQSSGATQPALVRQPVIAQPSVEPASSTLLGNSPSSQAQSEAVQLANERREKSLRGLERLQGDLYTTQSAQPSSDLSPTPEQQKHEEKARRIQERKERERLERERQEKEKPIQEQERSRKEKEDDAKEKLMEQERVRQEKQIREKQAWERQRLEKERQEKEREKQRREWERQEKERVEKERVEKERMENQRRLEKEILEKQRLENEKERERLEKEKEKREREERDRREREERDRREREERDRREREERDRWEREERDRREREEQDRREREEGERREREEKERREREERERREREREEQEKRERQEKEEREKQEKENARIDRELWTKKHLERFEAARELEERDTQYEGKEKQKRVKIRKNRSHKERKREYDLQMQDYLQSPLSRQSSQSSESDSSYEYDTDALAPLASPSRPIPARKGSMYELAEDTTISRSIDDPSFLSSLDRPTARSPPVMRNPSSVENDTFPLPLSTGLGRRKSYDRDIDAPDLLAPPSRPRKDFMYELAEDSSTSRSNDDPSRLSSSDRLTSRSPPVIWNPSSVEDDAFAKPLPTELGRRNSTTSIKSTGSVGVRNRIVDEPIPERSDSEAEYVDEDATVTEPEDWLPTTSKPRERERRREHRKSSASDGPRGDESYAPHFSNPRASYRAEDTKLLPPRDRYESDQTYRNLRYHRSEEIPPRSSPSVRAPLRREASFNEEYNDKFPAYHPTRPIRARTSFEDRGGPLPPFQPPISGRVPSRPSSTLNDERDYYDQAAYRPYPTPPSSATRSSGLIREHMTPPSRYPTSPYSPGFSGEARSNTFKYAQQLPESPPSRRPSESRPNLNRGPSYTQTYSDEPSPMHASPSDSYSRPYDRAPSASIPITGRQHRSSYGPQESDNWRLWPTESPQPRRELRRESERRERYDHNRDDFQDTEYPDRDGREYEVWHPDPYPYYGPHPEPPRRKSSHSVRSPMASHPGSYHDIPEHSFGGRERTYDVEYDSDGFADDMDADIEPNPRYRDISWKRHDDNQRSPPLDEEERNRWEAEDWRIRMAEEAERRRQADERKRFTLEEEEARWETKQETKKRKEAKRQAAEVRLDGDPWQREALRRQAEEARKAKEEAMRIAEEARRKEEEARRQAEEATRKEEEARRKEEEARRKEEEVRRQAEEARRKEEKARKQAEETKRKEEEVRRKEVAAREEARRIREETWQREQEMKYREEELKKREEELQRREREIEAERLRKEEEESRREAEKLQKQFYEEEEQRRLEEQKKREEKFRYEQQQQEFRRREQEIHERKRQDSMGGTFPASYASSPASPARSHPFPSATGAGINGQTSGWSSSPKPSNTSKASSSASAASKSRSGSINTSFPPSTPSPHPPPTFDEAEFRRKQDEFLQQQQEKFRKEQQRFEETRQRTESNKLSPEQVLSTLDRHDRQWNILLSSATIHWGSIPWPVFFLPQSPEDITLSAVTTYLQSPLLPDREKAKPQKDRLKEMIKKWHPDRFETKYLPRIIEGDREKVKEGTGVVIRLLNELLTKVNTPGSFGFL